MTCGLRNRAGHGALVLVDIQEAAGSGYCCPQELAMNRAITSILAVAVGLFAGVALAQDQGQPPAAGEPSSPPKARIELIVPRTSVRPGETLAVGVRWTMEPGWHIYWKNPGDSGQAPRFEWSLPGGGASRMMRGSEWRASDPEFPVPVRWEDGGGLVGYGYAGSVTFPAEIRIPPSATPGQVVEVGVVAQYLVCKDVCLSEWASAGVKLTVSAESVVEDEDKEALQAIEAGRQSIPAPSDKARVEDRSGGMMLVSVAAPAGATNVNFFPDPPSGLVVEDVQVNAQGDQVTAQFKLRAMAGAKVEAREFEAVVGWDTNQGRRGVSVRVPVPEGIGQ